MATPILPPQVLGKGSQKYSREACSNKGEKAIEVVQNYLGKYLLGVDKQLQGLDDDSPNFMMANSLRDGCLLKLGYAHAKAKGSAAAFRKKLECKYVELMTKNVQIPKFDNVKADLESIESLDRDCMISWGRELYEARVAKENTLGAFADKPSQASNEVFMKLRVSWPVVASTSRSLIGNRK
uniref:Uncharacterized protein n=1 Tax=Cannabis sativa TaxID=3483 RepID=A0A803PIS4_CANSA